MLFWFFSESINGERLEQTYAKIDRPENLHHAVLERLQEIK